MQISEGEKAHRGVTGKTEWTSAFSVLYCLFWRRQSSDLRFQVLPLPGSTATSEQ